MPGYYIHLAGINPKARSNRSFILGVEAPDLLKKYLKLYGLEGAREKYNTIKTDKMPSFSYFEERLQQQENKINNNGMHYGSSSKPDIWTYWHSLTEIEKQNPFYIGYLWHLLEDILFYQYIRIDKKFKEVSEQYKKEENYEELMKSELDILHKDWDKTNGIIKRYYPDVILPPEIVELGIVNIIEGSQTKYVDWNTIKLLIDYFRTINPLETNITETIFEIMDLLPKNQDYSLDTLNQKLLLTKSSKQI